MENLECSHASLKKATIPYSKGLRLGFLFNNIFPFGGNSHRIHAKNYVVIMDNRLDTALGQFHLEIP